MRDEKDRFATSWELEESRDERAASGRGRRACLVLVVPPYKNARCLKLEETIRGWAGLSGVAAEPSR